MAFSVDDNACGNLTRKQSELNSQKSWTKQKCLINRIVLLLQPNKFNLQIKKV